MSKNLNKLKEEKMAVETEKMHVESDLQIANGLEKGDENRYKMVVSEILETQNKKFNDEATKPILDTVSKLEENIKEKITKLQLQNEEHETKFNTNMENMSETTKNMMQETSVLSDVLKNSKKRGKHAEIGLERIFEMSHMVKDVHYVAQPTNEEGQRPDFIVKLPENKNIVIDSKAPLDALWESYNTDDEKEKEKALDKHVSAVKTHINELEKRDYTKNNISSLEYVIMVVPEYALLPALEQENKLIEYALEKHVILSTHSTLMVLLRTVELLWKQSEMSNSVKEIGELTTEVYDQLYKFTTHYTKTGKELKEAVEFYNKGVSSLDSKVLPKLKKLSELSSTTKEIKAIPMVDKAIKQFPEN